MAQHLQLSRRFLRKQLQCIFTARYLNTMTRNNFNLRESVIYVFSTHNISSQHNQTAHNRQGKQTARRLPDWV